ncbi:hypothetical protein GQX73_g4451 [Xylaria multiplex]|uniref:Uncharacterized protein n=1 Tax=Xylaria multiplex TaxID=323545 RepID=A0A7C8MS45_9PEZI|nr:hypothetical protein GQX73_g4451 [Xylaria multiplex]
MPYLASVIIGIVGSSVTLIVTLIGLTGRSVGARRSRQHLLEVQRQKKILRHKLRKAGYEIGSLRGISAQGVYHLRCETRNLIKHAHLQIEKFERFYREFNESGTVRSWNYIAISAGSDKISKYAKRFETYSDWITIARLSISLTLIRQRVLLGGACMSSSYWRDFHRLRDELDRVKRTKEAHPGRLRKLQVNKGVDLGRVERYADGLVLGFSASDTSTTSSVVIIDDRPGVPAQYRPVLGTWEQYHGYSQETQVDPPIGRPSPNPFMYHDQVYNIPYAPPNMYTSVTRSGLDTGRGQDDRRFKHSRSRNRTATPHPESSGSRRSPTLAPDSGHDGDDEWNMAPIPQEWRRPREKHRHSISRDRADAMTSGLGRSEDVERRRHSRRHRQSTSRSNETHNQPRSHQSYHSEQGSDQEIRGRDVHRRNFQDSRQSSSSSLRYRHQSRSSHSPPHANARREQQRRENIANVEVSLLEVSDWVSLLYSDDRQSGSRWRRDKYLGSLTFNIAAFILPALYSTLSKLWVANIDSSMVVTTDVYTYLNTAAEAINEGLPRASWVIIGDKASRSLTKRLQLTHTLILFQGIAGLILSIIFLSAASAVADSFVPSEVRQASLTYVRIVSFTVLASTIETAVATATRALDKPDVPLVISSVKFTVNIILDFLIISRFHVGSFQPTVNMQAVIQLVCGLVAAFAGLGYFLWSNTRPLCREMERNEGNANENMETNTGIKPTLGALVILLRPGLITFAESAIRNALYLWLVTTIVALGTTYATAWGVFNTIRWGLVMVPVNSLEATALQFIGHRWGKWRSEVGVNNRRPKATWKQVFSIIQPALSSLALALAVEVPFAIFLSLFGAHAFAQYLSGSKDVADVTAYMWRTIDWCYIFYAMSTQLATILLATRPKWYLYQSLASNILYVLPWAIVCQVKDLSEANAWGYHSLVFGGSLVFSFIDIVIIDAVWVGTLITGRVRLDMFRG